MGYMNSHKLGLAQQMKVNQMADMFAMYGHFNADEVKCLLHIFRQFTMGSNRRLDRLRFRSFFHAAFFITDDIMLDLLFRGFDRNSDGTCDEEEFVNGLSVYIRGTLEEQTELAYRAYDMNSDGSLAREELYHCLRGCICPGYGIPDDEIEEAERDIVETAMKKLDFDRDGQITFQDFKNAVRNDPNLLVAVGPSFPADSAMAALLATITEDYRTYSGNWYVEPKIHARPTNARRFPTNHRSSYLLDTRKSLKNQMSHPNASRSQAIKTAMSTRPGQPWNKSTTFRRPVSGLKIHR